MNNDKRKITADWDENKTTTTTKTSWDGGCFATDWWADRRSVGGKWYNWREVLPHVFRTSLCGFSRSTLVWLAGNNKLLREAQRVSFGENEADKLLLTMYAFTDRIFRKNNYCHRHRYRGTCYVFYYIWV